MASMEQENQAFAIRHHHPCLFRQIGQMMLSNRTVGNLDRLLFVDLLPGGYFAAW